MVDLQKIYNPYFDQTVSQIYPTKYSKINQIILMSKPPFSTFNLFFINNGIVSSTLYDKRYNLTPK